MFESWAEIIQTKTHEDLFPFCSIWPVQTGRCGSSSNSSAPSCSQESEPPQGLGHAEDAAEHEHMKAVLRTSLGSGEKEGSGVPGLRTRTRSRPGRGGEDDYTYRIAHSVVQCVSGSSICLLDLIRSQYAGVDPTRGGHADLWRRRRRWDHGAHREVGHPGSRKQSSASREEKVQGQPQVMYAMNAEPLSHIHTTI